MDTWGVRQKKLPFEKKEERKNQTFKSNFLEREKKVGTETLKKERPVETNEEEEHFMRKRKRTFFLFPTFPF